MTFISFSYLYLSVYLTALALLYLIWHTWCMIIFTLIIVLIAGFIVGKCIGKYLHKIDIPFIKKKLWDLLIKTSFGYKLSLKKRGYNIHPDRSLKVATQNGILKSKLELDGAIEETIRLGLLLHGDTPKNWDSFSALQSILKLTNKNARILDAGGEEYSSILPCLFLYGYKNLICVNTAFPKNSNLGPISYQYANILESGANDSSFDVITCLSVIEHGIGLDYYFREMSRILKPGGMLITSTDYWDDPINTYGLSAYNCPVKIFCKEDIFEMIDIAKRYSLELTTKIIDLDCQEKVVTWKKFGLKYTFIILTMKKLPA